MGGQIDSGIVDTLGGFGLSILNIDEALLRISGFEKSEIFNSDNEVRNLVMQYYKSAAYKQALRIVGALDIVGSPATLFSNIGTGFVEFYQKPADGFSEGTMAGLKGIGKGTWSLFKSIVGGVLNSCSVITGVLADGVASLTFDNAYNHRRGKRKVRKAKHCGDGIWMS